MSTDNPPSSLLPQQRSLLLVWNDMEYLERLCSNGKGLGSDNRKNVYPEGQTVTIERDMFIEGKKKERRIYKMRMEKRCWWCQKQMTSQVPWCSQSGPLRCPTETRHPSLWPVRPRLEWDNSFELVTSPSSAQTPWWQSGKEGQTEEERL